MLACHCDLMSVLSFYIEIMVQERQRLRGAASAAHGSRVPVRRPAASVDPPQLSAPQYSAPRRCRLEHGAPGARDLLRHQGAVVIRQLLCTAVTTIIKVCERQCSSFVQCFDHTLASAVHLGTRAGSTLVCARWYLCCAGLRPSMRGRADYLCLLLLPPSRAHAV